MSDSGLGVAAYVGIGSNLDNPLEHVCRAFDDLAAIEGVSLCARSALYRSAPMGPQDQPDFVNAAALLQTHLPPLDLLQALLGVEQAHGRVRCGAHWGPRTLDLDLLLYADRQIDMAQLTVPHPGLSARAFVLYPLRDITPDLIIPAKGRLRDLCAQCPDAGLERLDRLA